MEESNHRAWHTTILQVSPRTSCVVPNDGEKSLARNVRVIDGLFAGRLVIANNESTPRRRVYKLREES